MKAGTHLLLLTAPLILWVAVIGWRNYSQARVRADVAQVDSLQWTSGEPTDVSVERTLQHELESYRIVVRRQERVLLEREVAIDWDMGGGGIVGAAQLDDDADLELLVADSRGAAESFYLDATPEGVREVSVAQDPALRRRVAAWVSAYVPNVFGLGALMLATLGYYLLYVPVWFMLRVRRKRGEAQTPA